MMKKEHQDLSNTVGLEGQKHSMVCNDQLFLQELRIAAEEAEKGNEDYEE
jgi:hypothetical protein